MSKTDPIIIIGAGIGGMSAAIRLAIAGETVIILEKNETVGGKMAQVKQDGFRWDTGPSVITMRNVFEDLFALANKNINDYLTLEPVDPLTRYFFQDGTQLDISSNLTETLEQIDNLDPRDVDGYLSFLAYAARIHRLTKDVFIYDHPPTLKSLTKVPPWQALQIDGLRTMQQSIKGFVKSPHMQQLLGRFATYVGASPYQAPATLNVIAHVELSSGIWYPRGGIYKIAQAYKQLAYDCGATIRINCSVTEILTQGKHVTGVKLDNGETIDAKAIIANMDVGLVYDRLLPETVINKNRANRIQNMETSCSGFVLLLGVDKKHSQLAHHNIFFSSDYAQEFKHIFKDGIPPQDPTIYVAITSKTDPDHAPAGHENWFVLVNTPPIGEQYDWTQNAQSYREHVLSQLANRFGIDVRQHIVSEKILTPIDLEQMSGARRGALYGTSSNNRWAAFLRPHNRAPDVKGLYFAGGTTHPGGGVPMVTLSGKVAAELVLEDLSG